MSPNHPAIPARDPGRLHYVCGAGHESSSERPLRRCPFGPCPEPALRRIGPGSRKGG
jgi:hypothetical protein